MNKKKIQKSHAAVTLKRQYFMSCHCYLHKFFLAIMSVPFKNQKKITFICYYSIFEEDFPRRTVMHQNNCSLENPRLIRGFSQCTDMVDTILEQLGGSSSRVELFCFI